ncbi:hypothetical protein FNJ87_09655 [Nonlabens mediterrranea]|uniref:Pyruvate ferredoxin oxidoreductase n=1 Tax=Nonlabens mediterrranea TaxID=1419947 RepID=A0ABS0A6U2_9FLAO|nr:hypothetical protein BBFL7_02125 [Flavobacteria bacterium BBFL7]MBF4984579.1 hypothetical protein [Nonlabens mediterrranea]
MNELLHKYWEGQSSLEEEQKLVAYFNSDAVAPEHEMYRSVFNTFDEESAMIEDLNFDAFAKLAPEEKPKDHSKIRVLKGLGIAAGFAALLAVGSTYMGTNNTSTDLGTYEDPKEAYHATVEALQLVSTKFNNGRKNLKPLTEINNKTEKVFKTK